MISDKGRPSVDQISRIGMDTSKHVFQLHGVNAAEMPVLRRSFGARRWWLSSKLAPDGDRNRSIAVPAIILHGCYNHSGIR